MSLFGLAFTFFLIINPIGNAPFIAAIIRQFDLRTQNRILVRELLFTLLIAFFFLFAGERFLSLLELDKFSINICGGFLLSITAFALIFPKVAGNRIEEETTKAEPFFVPIATPLLAGPGFMTQVMVFANKDWSMGFVGLAIFLAWIGTCGVVMLAPHLQRILGRRGIVVLEQLMGMILLFISTQLIVEGVRYFWDTI